MATYIFKSIKSPDNPYEVSNITFEVDTQNKTDLIEEFIRFLNACGYSTKDLEEEFGLE